MKKRLRPIRLRFSLASFLLAVAVFGVCIVLGARVNEARKQHQAVALIEKLGGDVIYDFQVDENGEMKFEADANGNPIGPAQPPPLRRLLEQVGLESLYMTPVVEARFRNPQIIDNDLMPLGDLPQLRNVSIYGPRITDEGIKHLSSATKLHTLDLISTQETDASLKMYATLPSLRSANLTSPNITDVGVRHLRELSLTRLSLNSNHVTDRAMEYLAEMRSLEMVTLGRTQVTDAGVAKLKSSLPNCTVLVSE